MSATDELRRLLDERGISYINVESIDGSYWGIRWFVGDNISAQWRENGERHELLVVNITPEQAIAATLGDGTLTAEWVRDFLNRHSMFDDTMWMHGSQELVFDEDELQAMADELSATLGRGEGEWTWFELSCGHTFKLYGLDAPVACPVCGKAVKR